MKLHRFPKSERLRSKKIIEKLFNPALPNKIGGNVFLYPFKIVWLNQLDTEVSGSETENKEVENKSATMPQVLFSISKRNFKRANKRNRIRRQLKEIYRTHKTELFKNRVSPPVFSVIYVAKEENEFAFLKKKLLIVLDKMLKTYQS